MEEEATVADKEADRISRVRASSKLRLRKIQVSMPAKRLSANGALACRCCSLAGSHSRLAPHVR